MLEDVLLLKDIHYKAAEKILDRLIPFKKDKIVIAVCGESGAGKSELAHVIGRNISNTGKLVKILHSDNYYKIAQRKDRVEKEAWY